MCSSFGDQLRTKRSKTIRIAFFNPNGIGSKGESLKMECVYSFLRRHNVDVFGLSETNVDWRIVKYRDSMWGRTETWFENRKLCVAHNLRAPSSESTYQVGGTATMIFDKLAACKTKVESDHTKLGRWSSILIYGKGSVKSRIVTVYCPCKNQKKGKSVYQQHLKYFKKKNMEGVCPINQFWKDLKAEILRWTENGEQVIIGGDWNRSIQRVNKKMDELGLREVITTIHGLDSAPPTHNRGSKPIDGIFANSTIQPLRCGYLPFNKCISSDHRILWMDIPVDSLVGFGLHDTTVPAARRLKMNDPRVKKKYNDYLHDFSVKHKLYDLIASIYQRSTYPMPADVAADLIRFDRLRTEGMVAAEKRCRKLHRGVYPWSPEFSKARDMIKLWTMVKQRKMSFSVDLKSILRVSNRINERVDLSLTLLEVQNEVDKAWKEYFMVQQNAKELRNTFVRELAAAKAAEDNTSVASKLRQLLNQEDLRRISKAVKFTLGKLYSSGLTRVLAPDVNGDIVHEDGESYREITDRNELETTLLRDNPRKYHRCEPYCDLLQGQLLEDIGYSGEGPRVQDVLNGTYECPPDVSRGTKLFLAHMTRHPQCDSLTHISCRSSVEEFRRCWKRAREQSSSHGALHNAHYKVGCENKHIRHMHYAMSEVLFRSGCYLDRHRHGIDCMLVKKADDYRLQKLRTIFLFDAELNMNMGRVGDAGLASYIASGDMADEQYSRPCRSAIDHVVNRRLTFDYFYLTKKPFGMCSCDLAGNYDRIVHGAASLALQRIGVPLSRIHGLFDTIQRMIKKVRTAFGDSAGSYGGDHVPWRYKNKPMGVYQGNRIGPPIWSVISSTIFSILRKEGFGINFVDALTNELYKLVGFSYVDDTDLAVNGENSFEVAKDLQDALDLYGDLMRATGQSLAPEKSWWYLIDLVWKGGKWRFTDGGVCDDLVATDSNGDIISLKRLVSSEAKKMLGVYLAPDGCKKAEIEYLTDKAKRWADMIRTGHLGPVETWIGLSTGIWKSILYPMAATTFTEAEIRRFTSPILNVALPRMLVNRNLAVPLRYGPRNLGGLGLPSPYMDQGLKKVQYIVEHLWKQTPTGKILQRNISSLCLEGGFFGNPFTRDTQPLQWMTSDNSWISFAWAFMEANDIQINHLPCKFLAPLRADDEAIMTGFSRTDASPTILTKLNTCRLYLQVTTLSEICLADGKSVDRRFLYADSPLPERHLRNGYTWPTQPRPAYAAWKLWDEYVRKAFCGQNSHLSKPLGHFLDSNIMQEPRWDWYATKQDGFVDTLWHFDHEKLVWTHYIKNNIGSRRRPRFHKSATVDTKPCNLTLYFVSVTRRADDSCVVISTCDTGKRVSPVDDSEHILPPPVLSNIFITGDDFRQALALCPDSSWFIRHLIVPDDITHIFKDFLAGSLLTGSDGSFNPDVKYGTACWRLESWGKGQRIFGYCIIPGKRSINSSFRCELGGIFGNSLCLWALAHIALRLGFKKDLLWKVLVSCDGYAALERSFLSSPDRVSTTYKHYDLVSAIIGIWRDMPCGHFPVYVKSHQDEIIPPSDLSPLAQINTSVDISAKSYMRRCVDRNTPIPHGTFHFGLPVVLYKGTPVSTELYSSLMRLCTESDLRKYWIRNWGIEEGFLHRIDWDGFERGMGMMTKQQSVFITKWLCRQISVGPISQRYDATATSLCLRCRSEQETLIHCIRCKSIRQKVQARLDHLFELLAEYGTCPILLEGIRLCTQHWLRGSSAHPVQFLSHLDCDTTIDSLCDLYAFGWWRFMQGIHLTCLRNLQESYFLETNPQKSLSFWHGRVIKALWKFLCDLHDDRSTFLAQRRKDLEPINPAAISARKAAIIELSTGLGTLRPFYHHLFMLTKADLRKKPVSHLRDWLRQVRVARENDSRYIDVDDDFSPTGKFRCWLMRR